jgi:phage-related protein
MFSLTLLAAAISGVSSVSAHHSYAMFDADKLITVDATVKEFQWTNPHSWLQVMVDNKGVAEEWSLELGPLVTLRRWGWKPHSVNPGDKVKVSVNPLRDGSRGGRLMSIVLPDGKTLGGQGALPATAVPASNRQ